MNQLKTKQEVFEELKHIIYTTTFTEDVTEESTLEDDLALDSLDVAEVVLECEKEFQITIPDESIEDVTTVQQLLDVICASLVPFNSDHNLSITQ